MIEKVDDHNAERIMRTEILDRFVIKSLNSHRRPSDLLGQFTEEEKKIEKFRNFRTGLSRYYWGGWYF